MSLSGGVFWGSFLGFFFEVSLWGLFLFLCSFLRYLLFFVGVFVVVFLWGPFLGSLSGVSFFSGDLF